jgi:hypothetical protein
MTNEEMNKKMDFIVEHQAKFPAEMEMMREKQAADAKLFEQQHRRLSDGLLSVIDILGGLTRVQARTEERVNSLAEAQARNEESIKRLTEAGARTDERLNNLINIVERHISGNGGPHSHA